MKKILIVDDSPTIRRMVRTSLQPLRETSFDEAGSGLEAIEKLELQAADLMILDMNMPDMHGLEVLRFVRGQSTAPGLPIVVLTTKGDDATRSAAIEAGASLFLTKPFDPQHLLTQAKALIS
jgi:two-component system chemotaxis response regulator CheY